MMRYSRSEKLLRRKKQKIRILMLRKKHAHAIKMKETGAKIRGLNNGKGKHDPVTKPGGSKSEAASLSSCFLANPNCVTSDQVSKTLPEGLSLLQRDLYQTMHL